MKITLPQGWEKCRTGIKGVRKWRNVKDGSWVTEMDDDKETLHCGAFGKPLKVDRTQADVQKTINALAVGFGVSN